jgi:hypothetical protein
MRTVLLVLICVWMSAPGRALAYRPFESTDAAVASKGEIELELGPVGFLKDGDDQFLVAPEVVFNLGIARDWEIVLQGNQLVLLGPRSGPRWRLTDTGLSVKSVLRDGCLQGASGPSVAVELEALLPTMNDEPGVGAIGTAIVSQRWDLMTIHVNGGGALTRAGYLGLVGGVILEGPSRWAVRPVAEVFGEWDKGGAWLVSGLLGAIWQVTDALSLDAAVRTSRMSSTNAYEARAGLTYAFSLWRDR